MGTLSHKLAYLAETKVKIREALQARGSEVTDEDTFRSYADYIADLKGGTPSGIAGTLFANGGVGMGNRNIAVSELRKPTITSATPGDGTIAVTWADITEATNYRIFTYLDGAYTRQGESTSTSYTITGLANGTEYGVYIIAYINGSWVGSDISHIVYATPTA